ncbi:MAG: hypothetical protein AB7T19_20395 [Planctomycetota bacterium]
MTRAAPDSDTARLLSAIVDAAVSDRETRTRIAKKLAHWLEMRAAVAYCPPDDPGYRYTVAKLAPWAKGVDDGVWATWRFAAAVDAIIVEILDRIHREDREFPP